MMDISFPLHDVTEHVNQTHLVCNLLENHILSMDDFSGYVEDEYGYYPEIFQWLLFPRFQEFHYEKLETAHIPFIDSDVGAWVGITSYGTPYHGDLYPSLIELFFGEEARKEYFDVLSKKTA